MGPGVRAHDDVLGARSWKISLPRMQFKLKESLQILTFDAHHLATKRKFQEPRIDSAEKQHRPDNVF